MSTTHWIANARMYGIAPHWRELFARVAARSGLALDHVEHAWPAPLAELWQRADLGAVFMCGLPLIRAATPPRILAAPCPLGMGGPFYQSHFVVAADAPFERLADTFGQRLAYTVTHSQSGFNAPRRHLAGPAAARGGGPLYRQWVGPLHTPRRVMEAVIAGQAEVGPVDSYFWQLAVLHAPELVARLRIIDSTAPRPAPPLVAAPQAPQALVLALREALLGLASDATSRSLLASLALEGFAVVALEDYRCLLEDAAVASGGSP